MPIAIKRVKNLLVGRPLPSERLEHERLSKKTALAVLSSDAISSVAYATDQILFVVGGAMGLAAINYVLPISAVIVGLLVLVALSYRQTIFAYPSGGGSYTVAKDNLGVGTGLVAAAALLTDYILTVAVSISSGVAAITSAYPGLLQHTVLLCIVSIVLLTVVTYCYATGVHDSKEIALKITRDEILRFLCAGTFPTWQDIRDFTNHNHELVEQSLLRTCQLAHKLQQPSLWKSRL